MEQAAYRLVKLANGACSIRSLAHGETLHPVVGPVAEAEALYVRQLNLPDRLRARAGEFVIWDVGLGAAANALTVLRAVRDIRGSIRLVSFEHTPAPLQFALQHAAALGYFAGYEEPVAALLGQQQVTFNNGDQAVHWELHLADFPGLLAQPQAAQLPKPDAILFDPYSPAKNPAMWTQPLFANLYRLLDPRRPCALATFSRSTMLRVALLLAGFYVGAGRATGQKEETTIAANTPALIDEPLDGVWLQRARKSTSAEPLWEPVYRQQPLSPATWERLQQIKAEGRM